MTKTKTMTNPTPENIYHTRSQPFINTPFRQQIMKNWRPDLKLKTLVPAILILAVTFFPVGLGVFYLSSKTEEISLDYTGCIATKVVPTSPSLDAQIKTKAKTCSELINKDNFHVSCTCESIDFQIKTALEGQVYIYYALTNFHQNHRRYMASKDDKQLMGKTGSITDPLQPSTLCHPFDKDGKKIILPCGAIANSMFMDEIKLFKGEQEIPLRKQGICGNLDKKFRFKNPDWFSEAKKDPNHPAWKVFTKPKAWLKNLWELEHGLENEDFSVWMKVSALSNFRKLYRFVDHKMSHKGLEIKDGLPVGNYSLMINYSFPVVEFRGTKSIVIATNSFMGSKNQYIGPAYIVVCSIFLLIFVIFVFIHLLRR